MNEAAVMETAIDTQPPIVESVTPVPTHEPSRTEPVTSVPAAMLLDMIESQHEMELQIMFLFGIAAGLSFALYIVTRD